MADKNGGIMDAKELTEKYYKMKKTVDKLDKQVEYLTQEYEKQRMIMSDLQVDVKMLSRGARHE